MSEPPVLVEQRDAVLDIRFNRPATLNALTEPMLLDAAAAIGTAGDDPQVRVILLGGVGRAFSAGADISGIEPGRASGTATLDAANRLVRTIRDVPKPVVAGVRGPVAGVGCSVVLAADLAVAAESSYLLFAFAGIGLMPDGGATALLPAAAGRARATRLAMLGERIDARDAEQAGLLSHCVPDGEFDAQLERLLAQLSAGPTNAYAAMKEAFNATALAGLDTAFDVERQRQVGLFATDDFAEGIGAFRAKRPPRFTGRRAGSLV